MMRRTSLGLLLAAGSTLLWALFWLGNARISAEPVVRCVSPQSLAS